MQFIKDKAKAVGVDVYTTDRFDDGWRPQQSAKLRQAFDDPEAYDFIDISQVNSRSFGEGHWKNLLWVMAQREAHPRPINHTKIYSDGQTKWGSGTPQDGIERFWRNLLLGSASARFHRDGGGIGLNELAQACIRPARTVESFVRFWELTPHMELLSDREENEAYVAAKPGEAYVVFFPKGGSIVLDLRAAKGEMMLRWIEIAAGEQRGETAAVAATQATLSPPSAAPWVAVVTD